MAKLSFGAVTGGFDMSNFDVSDLLDYDKAQWNSTKIYAYNSGSDYSLFTGSGLTFKVQSGQLAGVTGGTIKEFKLVSDGETAVSLKGVSVSAKAVGDAVFSGNSAKFLSILLVGNDTIKGTKYADVLKGEAGNDTISGFAGKDKLFGGDGKDVLIGGAGGDVLNGGAGKDTASYADATKGVVANLAKPSVNTNDAKGDTYVSIENLRGSAFNDALTGNAGNNKFHGANGADILTGGAGDDTFIFKTLKESTVSASGQDTILDFSTTHDKIDISVIDANSATPGDQAFSFIGTKAFSGKAGELRYDKKASDTYIYGDVNGDGKADFAIHLDDAVTLQKGYFVL